MKLLYITNGINGSGGLERVLSVKASYLAEHYGYIITILSLNNGHLNTFYNFSSKIKICSIEVGGNPLVYISSYRNGIQKVVEDVKPDLISVCDDGLKGFFIPHFLKTKAPIVYERHVSKLIEAHAGKGNINRGLTKVKWKLMEILAGKFSKFILLTEGNRKEWSILNNLAVISNPLPFHPQESSNLDQKTVISVGKISYQKGQDMLLRAWEIVAQNHPDWKLELYGTADEGFLDMTRWKDHNVFYYPPEKNIMQKYLGSSIFVLSSRYEGFGMVLIEAMSCGLPVVSFDCPHGPSDIITNGQDGFLIENGNTKQFAEMLQRIISDEDLRHKMGTSARNNVKRYLKEGIVKEWDTLFKKILKKTTI